MLTRPTVLTLLLLAACSATPAPPLSDSPDPQMFGIAESAIVQRFIVPNGDGTTTTTLQFFGAPVSDDEMADAPSLICDDTGTRVKSSTVRSPTAMEALADGTLMMIVTCGA